MRLVLGCIVAPALALAIGACAHHARGPSPHQAYEVAAFPVPRADAPRELAACKPGVPFLAHEGGVVAAGANAWIVAPGGDPITSVACDEAGDLFLVRGGALVMQGPSGDHRVELPDGTWQVVGTPIATVWLYGTLRDGGSAILHYSPDDGLGVVHTGPEPIRALAAVGTDSVAAVVDRDLVIWRNNQPIDLGAIGPRVDGLAIDDNGVLYVSGPDGVARMNHQRPSIVMRSVHGPLRTRGTTLYVYWRDGSTVFRVAARAEELEERTVDLPPEKPSMFREGPANDRKSSMDVGASYTFVAQTAAQTTTDAHPLQLTQVKLARATTMQGATFELDLMSGTEWRLFFQPLYLTLVDGSAPVAHVATSPASAPGKAQTVADVGYVGLRLPIGYRIPLGYFTLSFGSGIELGIPIVTGWQNAMGVTQSISSRAALLPEWARFEYEPSCAWGLFLQAGYARTFYGDAASYGSVNAGFEYRFARHCN